MSFSLNHFAPIPYIERSYEGDAHGARISRVISLCNEKLNNTMYKETIKKQMEEWIFCSKNINADLTFCWLNKIPFTKKNGKFVDIVVHTNKYVDNLSQEYRNLLFDRYPQLTIALQKDGKIKSPDTLMNQFFYRYIEYGGDKCVIDEKEQNEINDK